MREHLYKGKTIDIPRWIEGALLWDMYNGNKRFYILPDSSCSFDDFEEVHPDTVCQFVKDDLFEGDIIERPENHKCTGEDLSIGKYQVVYDSDNLRYGLKTIKSEIFKEGSIVSFHGKLTKIGNIHDETH